MHARTRTPVKDPQSERIFNTRLSVFIECWRQHERRENRWSSAQDSRFCQLECGSPLSRAEKDEMSNTIEYLCSLADLHRQGPNTKFIAIESYIRMYFISRREGADAVSEATALACLCIASKFAEDAPNTLACTTRLSPRCSARALRQAELDTFRRLDMTVDFQDSFFVMTELMILCLNWRLFHPDQIYALAERVSSLVYARLMPHLLGHRRDTIAAAVVLVALRLVPVDEALLDVTARRLLLHCCCERSSGDDTTHHAGNSAASQRAEPAAKHAPAASDKVGATSMLSRDIRALTLATQASACSSPPSQSDEVAGQHRDYYRVAGEIAALERIIWEVVGAELSGEVPVPMHPQPMTPMHAQSGDSVVEWQGDGGRQGETNSMAREKYFAA